ncbi:GNAT family N-acetyltransferase [Pseudoalteromonas sp. NBT06-2]|uniref:GNAT family N-acetyltransferase n=1 Tax=Pseudoalteromonas sp. NBT06-2 TaxID=2025950 RepID=UPI000BA640D7|nr:GNAT family N-acetyltransferase [Pseudoalteromonas sp. NBT06-2]PAJ73386.1 GNAT family N-acetyltransferase [Pseudoalteromonas sp. NBT06-2]
MHIKVGKLRHEEVISLLQEHHEDMLSHSPPESVHALDLTALEQPEITFWSLWINENLAGIGALKELDKKHGEIKSMRTSHKFLRKGIARKMLEHIIKQAIIRSYKKLSLETGTMNSFIPAQKLYQEFDFDVCEPFGDYQDDPYSMFMSKNIG